MIDEGEKQEVLLQVVEGYVVERSADGKWVLSAFACDYENQFEIVRKAASVCVGLARFPTDWERRREYGSC